MIISRQTEYGRGRLKKYTASSTNGRHTLVITMEYGDATEMGFDVRSLDEILREDRERDAELKASARGRKTRTKQLALPAPQDF